LNPDLTPFKNAAGKLVIFHGWRDANIFAESSINYYKSAQAVVGASTVNAISRMFLVPGMDHCSGGTGPNEFGQVNWKKPPNASAENDVIAALDRWVTAGIAPERLVAAKYVGNNTQNALTRTRPLCPYPQVATYVSGNVDVASSFVCTSP
jgi:feruloyl esterase